MGEKDNSNVEVRVQIRCHAFLRKEQSPSQVRKRLNRFNLSGNQRMGFPGNTLFQNLKDCFLSMSVDMTK